MCPYFNSVEHHSVRELSRLALHLCFLHIVPRCRARRVHGGGLEYATPHAAVKWARHAYTRGRLDWRRQLHTFHHAPTDRDN